MADTSKSVSIRITGKVQGVFYRASTQEQAQRLHLTGFVRNEKDGSVYVEVSGPAEAVDSLVAWCRQGPPRARVEEVVVTPLEATPTYAGFQVRR
ncbi:acylphosphatase [Catalinimonas alkaloidigena]|uniref:acylphosphatase n=1 Tax=Catalinimonas alkaloidigena TaxID=1075417 RepID=A0A1G8WJG0_9BACT|nr:acylphosphatase [Catalinimonas alkaloidigena]SDJ78267.1 acylphosphatase [Catalinimonas alkaloidigena]